MHQTIKKDTTDNIYKFTPLPEPIPITEHVWPDGTIPIVHTRTMTYQHVHFIRECIEGILMQKTIFPVQVLIHDDASIDGTADIVREYELKYPKLIKAYYQKENSFKKVNKTERRAEFFSWTIGKYIALCEGDDYWIDPLKLQKQIDILEENPNYVLSHTNTHFLFATNNHIEKDVDNYRNADISTNDSRKLFYRILNYELKIRTPSVVFRKDVLNLIKIDNIHLIKRDIAKWLDLSQYGKFHYLEESTCVYRIHSGSVSRPKSINKDIAFRLSGLDLRFYYCDKYDYEIPQSLIDKYNQLSIKYGIFDGKNSELKHKNYLTHETKRKISLFENKFIRLFGKLFYLIKRPNMIYSKNLNSLNR